MSLLFSYLSLVPMKSSTFSARLPHTPRKTARRHDLTSTYHADSCAMVVANVIRERAESIGQQKELVFDGRPLPQGKHQLHCENIGDPTNAENTTFLIIGLFTV